MSKKRATAGNKQDLLFAARTYDILAEISFGENGVKLRLVKSTSSPKTYILCYSQIGQQWHIIVRFRVEEQWQSWKETYARIYNRKLIVRGNPGRNNELGSPKRASRKRSPPKAKDVSTQDSKQRNGKPRSKSSSRV